jgi:hypothetical protein
VLYHCAPHPVPNAYSWGVVSCMPFDPLTLLLFSWLVRTNQLN